MKIYRNKHQNILKKQMQKYYHINKIKINSQKAKWAKKQRKININFKIKSYLRRRIWAALKNISKSETTINLLGCSIEKLKQHLEKKFTKGMNWSNYGKWHIDHIRPCASFDLSKDSEQKKCFHYTNLQPLWAKDNLKKNRRI